MAAVAGNGGLIPWQTGIATSFGRFQFVLGREIGVSFKGYVKDPARFLLPVGDDVTIAEVRSLQLEFPFLEYRPVRTFSLDQTSSLVFKFYGGVDDSDARLQRPPTGRPLAGHPGHLAGGAPGCV